MSKRLMLFFLLVGASIQCAHMSANLWMVTSNGGQVHAKSSVQKSIQNSTLQLSELSIVASSTVAPVESVISTPTETPVPPRYYVVQEGDTLIGIAAKYDTSIENISYLNGIEDANVIYPGQEIVLDGDMPPVPIVEDCDQGKNVLVILETQKLYARNGCDIVREFIVSSGIAERPTITGDFRIYVKFEKARMTLYDYDLKNVPWTMYFSGSYGIHGKYWNDIYGTPTSSGCVNMTIPDAEWMYSWAEVGTPVHVREK